MCIAEINISHGLTRISTNNTNANRKLQISNCITITPNSEPPIKSFEGRLRTPNSSGFSLIEIIITLVVLSIAVVGVLSVFTTGTKSSADPLIINQAVQLAQEKMDEIIGDRRNPARGFAYIISYTADVPMTGFNRSVEIYCVNAGDLNSSIGAPGAGGCLSGYTRVNVTVAHAVIGSITMQTLITDY